MKKFFTLIAAAIMAVSASAQTETDSVMALVNALEPVTVGYTWIADNFTANGTTAIKTGTAMDNKVLAAGGADLAAATNKGKNTIGGTEYMNSARLKGYQRALCIRTESAIKVKVYYQSHAERHIAIAKTLTTDDGALTDIESAAEVSTTSYEFTMAAGDHRYITSVDADNKGADLYIGGFEVLDPNSGSGSSEGGSTPTPTPGEATGGVIFSWVSETVADGGTDADGYPTSVGNVTMIGQTATGSSNANRVNYLNAYPDKSNVAYHRYTLCLNGKSADVDSDNYIDIIPTQPFSEGDVITATGFYNKGEEKDCSIYFKYSNGTVVADDQKFADIQNGLENIKDYLYAVPTAAVGSTSVRLTRNASGTNIFITKLVITSPSADGIANVETVAAKSGAIYNLAGQRVNANAKGLVIMGGKKYMVK